MKWTHTIERLPSGRETRYVILGDGVPLSFADALARLTDDASFRDFLTRLLAGVASPAYRWETPPLTHATLARAFEFVLTADPHLDTRPQPDVFGAYFTGAQAEAPVLAVPNLANTAMLVVPRPIGAPEAYPHLARFLRHAPAAQVHALWQCVARTALDRLSMRPQWLSTAGRGIAWLHVRVENVPKYYSYKPYTQAV